MKTFSIVVYIRAENESDLLERLQDVADNCSEFNELIDDWNADSIRIKEE